MCARDDIMTVRRTAVTIDGFEDVPHEDEEALKQAVANQPVAVGIQATPALQLYRSGVFDGDCGTTLNHGVLNVGYGEVSFFLRSCPKLWPTCL